MFGGVPSASDRRHCGRRCSVYAWQPGYLESGHFARIHARGSLVQSISIPYPGDNCPGCEGADIAIGNDGHAYVYNGTFEAYLSEYDPASIWSHSTFSGLSVVGNVKHGGLTKTDRYVFMPDMQTAVPGGPDGSFAFISTSVQRFGLLATLGRSI